MVSKVRTVSEFLALPEHEQIYLVGFHLMGWTAGSGHYIGWNPIRGISAAWEVHQKISLADVETINKYCNWLARLARCDETTRYLPPLFFMDPLSFLILIKPVHICAAALVAVEVLE